jgi:hypothetical protein
MSLADWTRTSGPRQIGLPGRVWTNSARAHPSRKTNSGANCVLPRAGERSDWKCEDTPCCAPGSPNHPSDALTLINQAVEFLTRWPPPSLAPEAFTAIAPLSFPDCP